jgi:hypothetical protein
MKYTVTDIEYNSRTQCLTWVYGGKKHVCTGEFEIDRNGILHHTFITPRGKEKEVKLRVMTKAEARSYYIFKGWKL